jgi:peptide/nickel transport system substrate-binding protein
MPSVANGYVGAYLDGVTGFADAQKAVKKSPTKAPDISGLKCEDDNTFVISLDNTSSAGVLGALSLPIGAPVPRDYAAPFDAETPSTYGTHQVATGPYMIENDSSGELTGYTSGKEIKLVRNPNWDEATDDRPAYLDSIDVQEGFTDTVSASKKILDSTGQVNGDFSIPGEALKDATNAGEGQLTLTPSGGDRYISLNTQKAPFDDINIRKAVIAASNRTDLRNTRGGELIGPVMTHFLAPNFPGFEEAGGLKGFDDLDYLKNPDGDMDIAAKYMKKAGFSSGKCEGSACEIDMVGDDSAPGSNTAEVFNDQLKQLGFKVNFQKVAHDVMFTKFCDVPKNEPDVCPNVGWIKDFQDPQAFLQVPFSGDSIVESNNTNWPLLDVPAINKAMEKAVLIDDPEDRAQAWADVDHMIAEQAPAVPWVWDNQANIQSKDVAGVINLFNANWDLSYTSLK